MKVGFYTLGCKANQFETEAIRNIFIDRGHESVDFSAQADIYIINTCAVTALSEVKSRKILRRCKKNYPDAAIIVCGCYSQIDEKALADCGADYIIGSGDKSRIVDIAEGAAADGVTPLRPGRPKFDTLSAGVFQRTRALLKIQDGCDNFCAYCIIPYARGPVRSMPRDTVLSHVKQVAANGYKELVLTGIEISAYGEDFGEKNALCGLISDICSAAPDMRIRLGSLEPGTVNDDFLQVAADNANLCPHFHLSLQSGCDKTLSAMGRRYKTDFYLDICRKLRAVRPNCAITTDLIVGFPGETDEDFAQTLDFIQKCSFADMHIFPYSKRDGTKAAKMPEHLPKSIKESRAAEAAKAAKKMRQEFLSAQVGKECKVLFEQEKDGYSSGHSENYCVVRCKGIELNNSLETVAVESVDEDFLMGRILRD